MISESLFFCEGDSIALSGKFRLSRRRLLLALMGVRGLMSPASRGVVACPRIPSCQTSTRGPHSSQDGGFSLFRPPAVPRFLHHRWRGIQ